MHLSTRLRPLSRHRLSHTRSLILATRPLPFSYLYIMRRRKVGASTTRPTYRRSLEILPIKPLWPLNRSSTTEAKPYTTHLSNTETYKTASMRPIILGVLRASRSPLQLNITMSVILILIPAACHIHRALHNACPENASTASRAMVSLNRPVLSLQAEPI